MAYVTPNTNVRLLTNCPLDNSYVHTLYFETQNDQYNYFVGLTKTGCVFTAQSYQRVNRNTIRLQCKPDAIIDCNYMMFQNASHLNKWFYAFILQTDYINENVAEITYEIDVLQTWYFNYSKLQCMIERTHVVDDAIGANIVPENIETGEYVAQHYVNLNNPQLCVILAIADASSVGHQYDNVFSGCRLFVYQTNDTAGIAQKLNEYIHQPEAVVSMYMVPFFALNGQIPADHLVPQSSAFSREQAANPITQYTTISGYTPHNKKLFTYPYTFYHIDNGSGGELNLRYEFFKDKTPRFIYETTVTQPVQTVLRPLGYKNSLYEQMAHDAYRAESISLENYPICSWSFDAYQAWIAQNAVPILINTGAQAASMLIGGAAATGVLNAMYAGATGKKYIEGQKAFAAQDVRQTESMANFGLQNAASLLAQGYKASIAADICKGSGYNGNVDCAHDHHAFWGGRFGVTYEMARCIDSFFDVYGYAINKIGYPSVNNRKHYTYVKTNGCKITGYLPTDDIRKIESIYDNGITYWKTGSELGNYYWAYDNTPNPLN